MKTRKRYSLCIVGNLLGRNHGMITTQGQILADLLAADGHRVTSCSSRLNRVTRLIDIAATIIGNARQTQVLILEVYSGLSMVIAEVAGLLARILRIPSIFVLHGGNLPDFARRRPRWTKRVLARASRLVAPSPFLAREIGSLGFDIRVVPNSIEIAKCRFKPRRHLSPKLIWMRAFHPIYNPQLALDVLQILRRDFPEARLVMAGTDKGIEPNLKAEAGKMDLGETVHFAGFLDDAGKAREFAAADIYLNTNNIDNMPVAVIEAMAMGLPVVATNVGGLPDIINDGENGLLVPANDGEAMARAVTRLLSDAELAERLSRNGRFFAERSEWEIVREQWEDLIAELVPDARKCSDAEPLRAPSGVV